MRWPYLLLCSLFFAAPGSILAKPAAPQKKPPSSSSKSRIKPSANPVLDHSGEARRGKASYYGKAFYGRVMANGTRMNPHSNVAASRTLPLGTKVVVKNLVNGKSEIVEIQDRGPYIDGRIIDLSPKVADDLGMRESGVVPVEVRPLQVPQPDGTMKRGVAALEDNRHWLTSGE